ncbi:hypothetical protein B0O99DRAFT_744602 [Bisporella sp. PMI_857]|nr:hypothetical protein B0O99DRAFT_744602 [Bisporella sp. PMI_857]
MELAVHKFVNSFITGHKLPRAKRADKKAAREAKGKANHGRKRKSVTPEPEEAMADKAKRGQKRKSAALEAEPPKAKVARILESKAPKPASALAAQISRTSESTILARRRCLKTTLPPSWSNILRNILPVSLV